MFVYATVPNVFTIQPHLKHVVGEINYSPVLLLPDRYPPILSFFFNVELCRELPLALVCLDPGSYCLSMALYQVHPVELKKDTEPGSNKVLI